MRRLATACALAAALLAAGCVTTFRQLETAYAPHDQGRPMQVYPRLSGEACQWRLFSMLAVAGDNSGAAAIASLTRGSAKIDNLIGVHVEEKNTSYLVVSSNCTIISAYPVVYKDAQPKLELFEGNMMAGRLIRQPEVSGGGTFSTPAPPSGGGETYKPVAKTEPPPPRVEPPRDSAPTQAQCESKCANFATLWKGSDAIRSTIRGQCVKKCLDPANKTYRDCIDGASKIEDIARCNSL